MTKKGAGHETFYPKEDYFHFCFGLFVHIFCFQWASLRWKNCYTAENYALELL